MRNLLVGYWIGLKLLQSHYLIDYNHKLAKTDSKEPKGSD